MAGGVVLVYLEEGVNEDSEEEDADANRCHTLRSSSSNIEVVAVGTGTAPGTLLNTIHSSALLRFECVSAHGGGVVRITASRVSLDSILGSTGHPARVTHFRLQVGSRNRTEGLAVGSTALMARDTANLFVSREDGGTVAVSAVLAGPVVACGTV